MLAVGFVVALIGYATLYSGIQKLRGTEVGVIAALRGEDGTPVPPASSSGKSGLKAPPRGTGRGRPPRAAGGTRHPKGTRKVTPAERKPKHKPKPGGGGGGGGSTSGCARPHGLQTWKGVTLVAPAMRDYKQAVQELGHSRRPRIQSSFRTCDQQKAACDDICGKGCAGCPGLCAPCGKSCHQRGAALDVSNPEQIESVMGKHGFKRTVLPTDPGHFAYVGICNG